MATVIMTQISAKTVVLGKDVLFKAGLFTCSGGVLLFFNKHHKKGRKKDEFQQGN